jgi:TDG/mug DNA glycosylase family protein
MDEPFRPTKRQLAEAAGKTIPDILAPGLAVLFVGINPGLYSAAVGHHFGRPGNRFWPALHLAGFTPRAYSPFEERLLLNHRLGITNIASRASARADELTKDELVAGGAILRKKVLKWKPGVVAVLGVTAYRTAFAQPKAAMGRQAEPLGESAVWVLPNPSGLNAHFTLDGLARLFAEVREAVGLPRLNVAEGTP